MTCYMTASMLSISCALFNYISSKFYEETKGKEVKCFTDNHIVRSGKVEIFHLELELSNVLQFDTQQNGY